MHLFMSTIQRLFIYSNLITTITTTTTTTTIIIQYYFISSPPILDTQAIRKFGLLEAPIWREGLNLEW